VITGGNRGLGLEITRQLAGRGLHVVIGARDGGRGVDAARALVGEGLSVSSVPLDVADPDSVQRAFAEVAVQLGRLDVLVNNAGIAIDEDQTALRPDFSRISQTVEINLYGAWRCCSMAIPQMRRHGYGRIVNLSSRLASLSAMGVGEPAYRVSKTALNALTRLLAGELLGSGILVNAVSPGWVRTEMGGPDAPRTVAQGAATPVWLATLPDDGPTGGFFADGQPVDW